MQVILLKDVPKLGKKFEVKNVPDGHARNFLLPRGFVELATPDKVARLEKERAAHQAEENAKHEAEAQAVQSLDGASVTIKVAADEQGHLFKKIKTADIADAIRLAKNVELPEEFIELEAPIAELGSFEIPVAMDGTKATVTCVVERE